MSILTKRTWRVLLPALVAVGVVGAAIPAMAGELDHDKDNNKLQTRMSFHCNNDHSVRLSWHSIWPDVAVTMTASWYDGTTDPDLTKPHKGTVHHSGKQATGTFTIPKGHNHHRIFLFVDALDSTGNQVFGLGRNIDTIRC